MKKPAVRLASVIWCYGLFVRLYDVMLSTNGGEKYFIFSQLWCRLLPLKDFSPSAVTNNFSDYLCRPSLYGTANLHFHHAVFVNLVHADIALSSLSMIAFPAAKTSSFVAPNGLYVIQRVSPSLLIDPGAMT